MPDWNNKKYLPLKKLTEIYVNCFNNRDFELLKKYLSNSVILERGKTTEGKDNVINHQKDLFSRKDLDNIKFELIDATAGFFKEKESQLILYLEIMQGGVKKETFIESLLLIKEDKDWKIDRIFGITFEPDEHKKYFESFLKEIKGNN